MSPEQELRCKNKDHEAMGAHCTEDVPYDYSCEFQSDLQWALATNQDEEFVEGLRVAHREHWGPPQ